MVQDDGCHGLVRLLVIDRTVVTVARPARDRPARGVTGGRAGPGVSHGPPDSDRRLSGPGGGPGPGVRYVAKGRDLPS
eukprot:650603-Hanusia_phi.AAC.1